MTAFITHPDDILTLMNIAIEDNEQEDEEVRMHKMHTNGIIEISNFAGAPTDEDEELLSPIKSSIGTVISVGRWYSPNLWAIRCKKLAN